MIGLLWILLIGSFFRLDSYEVFASFSALIKKGFNSISFKDLLPKKEVSESSKIIEDESFLDNVSEVVEDENQTEDNEPVEEEPSQEVDKNLTGDVDEEDLSIEKAVVEKEIDIDKNRDCL